MSFARSPTRRPPSSPLPAHRAATVCPAETARVGKGSHGRRLDYKNKGRVGTRKFYFSHLRVTVKQVPPEELARTRFFGRWREASKLLTLPWEERIKQLPRYVPPPDLELGSRRVEQQLVHTQAAHASESAAAAGRPRRKGPKWKFWTGSASIRPSRK